MPERILGALCKNALYKSTYTLLYFIHGRPFQQLLCSCCSFWPRAAKRPPRQFLSDGIVLRSTGNVYEFLGVEEDATKPQYNDKVVVLAFKSAETGCYFLCARDDSSVALQVVYYYTVHFVAFCHSKELVTCLAPSACSEMHCCWICLQLFRRTQLYFRVLRVRLKKNR